MTNGIRATDSEGNEEANKKVNKKAMGNPGPVVSLLTYLIRFLTLFSV